jgi:hypothetical protein
MSISVHLGLKRNSERGIGTTLVAGLMLVLWLGTVAFAASPQLHHWLHSDSKSATHECPVTLLSKSQLLAGGIATFILALIPIFFGRLPATDSFQFLAIDYRLSPSRAPPAFLSSITVAG